jgi:hypothetical protein
MRNLISTTKKRITPLLAASVLLTGGIGATVLFAGGTADAAACVAATPVAAGVGCSVVGTLTMTSGALTLTVPTSLTWVETVTGLDQQVVDVVPADQTYQVNDARGTDVGWNVTAAATTFVGAHPGTDTHTFGDPGPLWTNGSVLEAVPGTLDGTTPTATCLAGSTCTPPTDTALVAAYPVNIITTAAGVTPFSIYQAAAGTGEGTITIGGSTATDPVGWWVVIPSDITQDVYTSTITLTVNAAP